LEPLTPSILSPKRLEICTRHSPLGNLHSAIFAWRTHSPICNLQSDISLFQSERRGGVEIDRRCDAGAKLAKPGGRNHRRVVRGEREAREKRQDLAAAALILQLGAEPAVRGDAAGDADAPRLVPAGGIEQAIDE